MNHHIEIVCHRGANDGAPENSMAAAERCIELGVHYLEVDVRTSRDGVLYVLHDESVDRTTDGSGALADLTSNEVDRLDAGRWYGEAFAGERIPRLEHVLDWAQGRIGLFFDVKQAGLSTLVGLVHEKGFQKRSFFWFDNDERAHELRRLAPEMVLKINVEKPEDVRKARHDFGASIVETSLRNATEALREACEQEGVRLMILHRHDDLEEFRRIVRLGPDLVNLDHPALFLEAIETERSGRTL